MFRFWTIIKLEWTVLFLVAGCSPNPMQQGQFACGEPSDCPPGWLCKNDGYCYSDGTMDTDTDTGSTDETVSGIEVTRFVLIDSKRDLDIGELEDHATLFLDQTGDQLNIRAETAGAVDKVIFWLNGSLSREEKSAPYALAGNGEGDAVPGDYSDWTPAVGPYSLRAIPYDLDGLAGSALTIEFTVEETSGQASGRRHRETSGATSPRPAADARAPRASFVLQGEEAPTPVPAPAGRTAGLTFFCGK